MENPQPQQPKAKAPKVVPQPEPPALDAETAAELRYRFAGIALAEIVKWQVSAGKAGQEDVAASWAFRYADRMVAQAREKPTRATKPVRGIPEPVFHDEPPMTPEEIGQAILPTEPVPPMAPDAPGLT